MPRARVALPATLAAAGGSLALWRVPVLAYLVGGTIFLVFGGVVLPAVFMRTSSRRRDAREVLRLILSSFGPRRPPEG